MIRAIACAVSLLLASVTASADFVAEQFDQSPYPSSMLLQPRLHLYGEAESPMMFQGPLDESRIGMSLGYTDANQNRPERCDERSFSATAFGEYLITEHIGVVGKLGIRQMTGGESSALPLLDTIGRAARLDYRVGVGLRLDPSEVLSLHFEWERYAQGSDSGSAAVTPGSTGWDPWQQRNVFGAGVRFGF